jgi:hypothetical protein
MLVKFNKKQVKALASIHSRAVSFFNELQREKPSLYREDDRNYTIKMFELGILDSIIELCEISVED